LTSFIEILPAAAVVKSVRQREPPLMDMRNSADVLCDL